MQNLISTGVGVEFSISLSNMHDHVVKTRRICTAISSIESVRVSLSELSI